MRRPLRVLGLLVLLCSSVAAAGDDSFDVRYLLAVVGVAFITIVYRKFDALEARFEKKETERVKWQSEVGAALWGPVDGNGQHVTEHGIVHMVRELFASRSLTRPAHHELDRSARDRGR